MIKIRQSSWNSNKQAAYDELDIEINNGRVSYHVEDGYHCYVFYEPDQETFYTLKYSGLDWIDPTFTGGMFYCPYLPLLKFPLNANSTD